MTGPNTYPEELHDFAVAVAVRRSFLLNLKNRDLPDYAKQEAELWQNVCREGHKAVAILRCYPEQL